MSTATPRLGHAAVGAILSDMDRYLPSDTINRPDYRRCRTVYGLMNTAYRRIATSPTPSKEYTNLRALESTLRNLLTTLPASKGIPTQMSQYLDELRTALDDALTQGVTLAFVSLEVDDGADVVREVQPERVKMMPDTKYKLVRAELALAREKIRALNEENNGLVLRVKRLEMERDRAGKKK
jgi:hypothetical protein